MRELRKGIRLKFRNRDVAVDGNVRESGDVGGNSGKTAGRAPHVAWCPVHSRQPLKIRRTECRSRPVVLITASGLQGLGSGVPVPNPSTVGGLLELLTWRERTASCRPGDGLGTALSGAFPGRRTANSELVRTRGIRLDAHEWINEIPTVPVYYPAKPQPRERAWQNQRGKKTLLSLTLVRLCEMT
ncbi:hypothetical protein YC2023_002972 [Brassica napus]